MAVKEKMQIVITALLAVIAAALILLILEKAGAVTFGRHDDHTSVQSHTAALHSGEEHSEHPRHSHGEKCGHNDHEPDSHTSCHQKHEHKHRWGEL